MDLKRIATAVRGDHVVCKFDGGIRSIVEW